jgi:predicted nucleotidyltransferase
MPRVKIEYNIDEQIDYSSEQWELFRNLRQKAQEITSPFAAQGIDLLIFGSIARGDVKKTSDIDIILTNQIATYRIELLLEQAHIPIITKKIVQATPNDVIKAHLELEDNISIAMLLTDYTKLPFEFYQFGGAISYQQIIDGIRVPGVDKRLVLIQPNNAGHHALSIVNQPNYAADQIGISPMMVEQRIRVLNRRDKVGRTGVFLNEEIPLEESFEDALNTLAKKNQLIRRRIKF